MPEKPSFNRLNKYHQELSKLDLDEQIERIKKLGPGTLRRMISADAPLELVTRFAGRVKEICDPPLTPYEQGRIHVVRAEIKEAMAKFREAIRNGDPNGHKGMAHVLFFQVNKDDPACLHHIEAALNNGIADSETYLLLAFTRFLKGKQEEAKEFFTKTIELSPNPKATKLFIDGFLALDGGSPEQGMAQMEQAAKMGDQSAIHVLSIEHGLQNNTDKIIELFELGIKNGAYSTLNGMAYLFERKGDTQKAITYYLRALEAGYPEKISKLVHLLLDEGRLEEAKTACQKAIKNGNKYGTFLLALIANKEGNKTDEIRYIEAHKEESLILPPHLIVRKYELTGDLDTAISELAMIEDFDPFANFYLAHFYGLKRDRKKQFNHLCEAMNRSGLTALWCGALVVHTCGLTNKAINMVCPVLEIALEQENLPKELKQIIITPIKKYFSDFSN